MRLGIIAKSFGYVVDLDNEDMTDHAREAIVEDIMEAGKGHFTFDVKPDKDNALTESDIPDFLRDNVEFLNHYDCKCGCNWTSKGEHGESDCCECGELVKAHHTQVVEE